VNVWIEFVSSRQSGQKDIRTGCFQLNKLANQLPLVTWIGSKLGEPKIGEAPGAAKNISLFGIEVYSHLHLDFLGLLI
jgi:hypothetical protein